MLLSSLCSGGRSWEDERGGNYLLENVIVKEYRVVAFVSIYGQGGLRCVGVWDVEDIES